MLLRRRNARGLTDPLRPCGPPLRRTQGPDVHLPKILDVRRGRHKPNAAALAVIGPLTASAGDRFSGFHPNTAMFKSLRVFWVLRFGEWTTWWSVWRRTFASTRTCTRCLQETTRTIKCPSTRGSRSLRTSACPWKSAKLSGKMWGTGTPVSDNRINKQ